MKIKEISRIEYAFGREDEGTNNFPFPGWGRGGDGVIK